jgi:hypothetical protein
VPQAELLVRPGRALCGVKNRRPVRLRVRCSVLHPKPYAMRVPREGRKLPPERALTRAAERETFLDQPSTEQAERSLAEGEHPALCPACGRRTVVRTISPSGEGRLTCTDGKCDWRRVGRPTSRGGVARKHS